MDKKEAILIGPRIYRRRAILLTPLALVLGSYLVYQHTSSRPGPNDRLVQGRVVGRTRRTGFMGRNEPVLTLQIEGTTTQVEAPLNMNAPEDIPDRVSFYYSGDPTKPVRLQQENSLLWGGIAFLVLPCVMWPLLLWWERKAKEQASR